MKKRKAFITGINGQDGSYLSEFLLEKGMLDKVVERKKLRDTLFQIVSLLGKQEVFVS